MITKYINKDEFQKKVRAMKTKLQMEDNKTLTWVIYTMVSVFALLLVLGATIIFSTLLILFIIGLPLAFIEGIVRGYGKND